MELPLLIVIAALLALVVLVLTLRRSGAGIDLSQATEQLLKLAEERLQRAAQAGAADLDTKKQLVDQQVKVVKEELGKVTDLVHRVETERGAKFAELANQIKTLGEQAAGLTSATSILREALVSPHTRGQWGERMADDILRYAGFVEGVNYKRQVTLEGVGSRPDYTFLLPKGLILNMDVKFPLDNYLKALEASNEVERTAFENAFLRDVRSRIKEISDREYIDPEGGTVDCVLLFIPNDNIYGYVHQTDPSLLDEALRNRVVCCSPLTLFAVLSIIRQAVDNFALQKASGEILSHLGRFKVEWDKFGDKLEILGKRLASTQQVYEEVTGPRKRKLEGPLKRLEAVRQQRGLEIAPVDETAGAVLPEAEERDEAGEDTG
ncbi:MAG: DNA recombination protein RmuC [Dehalococcoidia bacterium]|nr:DNA recombination protein RmuC [Dehalococcoidia bacterium]